MNRKRKHSPAARHLPSKILKKGCTWKLPDEILVKIFSYVTLEELYSTVRLVCKRWNGLIQDATLWPKIEAGAHVPTKVLADWILIASQLNHLIVTDRNDINYILELVSQKCKALQTIEVVNCWGSSDKWLVSSTPLCHLLERCGRLRNIRFDKMHFTSCKFFNLLARDKTKEGIRSCSYIGPITIKQLSTIVSSVSQYELSPSAVLGNHHVMYKLVEIARQYDGRPNVVQNKLIHDLWNSINHNNVVNINFIDINEGEDVDPEVV